jgi:hypothetical protein
MRVNVYAEEMTSQCEIIRKEADGQMFTGLRFWLHLPVTLPSGQQAQGPFTHRPGDDDSSAVTFWGKQDLRVMLRQALKLLDEHYNKYDFDKAAKAIYNAKTANDPVVHCNQFPVWEELSAEQRDSYRVMAKAAAAATTCQHPLEARGLSGNCLLCGRQPAQGAGAE